MVGDEPTQPAYEIFAIEKVIILLLLACLSWKRLQIGTDVLLIITGTNDVLFNGINIDDLEWPWTLK